ncbi:hypothetical protein LXL04_010501 [Taraxacum kok-saghyz]
MDVRRFNIYQLSLKAEILPKTYMEIGRVPKLRSLFTKVISFTNTADEICTLTNIVAEEDPQEFIPRIVHLELIEDATGRHDDFKDSTSSFVDVKLLEGAIRSDEVSVEFHGYDGYDEDNDDEGDNDDVDSIADDSKDVDDLHIRVEEFIAKNIMKWKEEMRADKIRVFTYHFFSHAQYFKDIQFNMISLN